MKKQLGCNFAETLNHSQTDLALGQNDATEMHNFLQLFLLLCFGVALFSIKKPQKWKKKAERREKSNQYWLILDLKEGKLEDSGQEE